MTENPAYPSVKPCQTVEYYSTQDISRISSTSSDEDIAEIDCCPPKVEEDCNNPQIRKMEERKYQVQEPPVFSKVFSSESCQTVKHGPQDISSIHPPVRRSFTSPYDDIIIMGHSQPQPPPLPPRTEGSHHIHFMQAREDNHGGWKSAAPQAKQIINK